MDQPIGRLVVIEDEQPVRDAVLAALRAERVHRPGFADLPRPADVFALAPDLAILDVLLPSGNGFELARALRRLRELPIIFLTAGDAVADRVAGLELVHELLRLDGKALAATLTGSRAGIERGLRSLVLAEAIGGVIALTLLAALARVLVLLDRSVADARASEAAMRTFLADASHELRSTVAALQATAERLLRDQPTRPARDAIEAQLARNSRRLGRLIDDLLNLARLEAHEHVPREPVDLCKLASAAVAAARPSAPQGHIELATNGAVLVTGDHDAMLRAVRNLLENALAVADKVVVEVAQAADGATVWVADNGPGAPAEQCERIFEPFVRLAGSPRSGTGLGSPSSAARSNRTAAQSGATPPPPAALDSRHDCRPFVIPDRSSSQLWSCSTGAYEIPTITPSGDCSRATV